MSYTKQTWANGDVITADKLNHIEDGLADNSTELVVHAINHPEDEVTVLDKTFGEIRTAVNNGRMVKIVRNVSDEEYTGVTVGYLVSMNYEIYSNGVNGSIYAGEANYSASVVDAPYTLEALDAEYPYTM